MLLSELGQCHKKGLGTVDSEGSSSELSYGNAGDAKLLELLAKVKTQYFACPCYKARRRDSGQMTGNEEKLASPQWAFP